MQVERIEEMRLGLVEEAGIAALLKAAFDDDGYAGRSFYQQRFHLRLVTRRDGRIIGHIGMDFRDIRMGDRPVTVVGLGDVSTDPGARGQGIATTLLRAAIAEAKQTIADFCILFGEAPLYAANGFLPMPNTIRFIALNGNRTRSVHEQPSNALMVLPLGDLPWDPDALIDLVGHPI